MGSAAHTQDSRLINAMSEFEINPEMKPNDQNISKMDMTLPINKASTQIIQETIEEHNTSRSSIHKQKTKPRLTVDQVD